MKRRTNEEGGDKGRVWSWRRKRERGRPLGGPVLTLELRQNSMFGGRTRQPVSSYERLLMPAPRRAPVTPPLTALRLQYRQGALQMGMDERSTLPE